MVEQARPVPRIYGHRALMNTQALGVIGNDPYVVYITLRNRTLTAQGTATAEGYAIADNAGWVVSLLHSRGALSEQYPHLGSVSTIARSIAVLRRYGWIRTFRFQGASAYALGRWDTIADPWGINARAEVDPKTGRVRPVFLADVWALALEQHIRSRFGARYVSTVPPVVVAGEARAWARDFGRSMAGDVRIGEQA